MSAPRVPRPRSPVERPTIEVRRCKCGFPDFGEPFCIGCDLTAPKAPRVFPRRGTET